MTCFPKIVFVVLMKKLLLRNTPLAVDVYGYGEQLISRYSSVSLGIPKRKNRDCPLLNRVFSVFLVLISLCTTTGMAEVDQFAKKGSEFALDLYSKITQGKDNENVIFSPFSIQTCLALAYAGAGGKTAEELFTGLRLLSNERSEVASSFKNVLDQYENNPLLKIANKVYVMTGHELSPEFNDIAVKSFHSEAENINFGENVNAANKINGWVEKKTNEKIKKLISSDDLNADTRAVLLNAIYFKGFWEKKFDKSLTMKDDFYTSETDSVKVDMMLMTNKFLYGEFEDLDASAIEMPYKDSNLSMVIILPNKKTGLKDVEAKLTQERLSDLRNKMYESEVTVKLPRFKIETSVELNEPLKQLGMKTMFSDSEADFSNLLQSPAPLKVSKVVHKAFIEVNEEGAEAAAATGVIFTSRTIARPRKLSYFYADHPFFFVLKSESGILFAGRVMKFD